MSEVIFEDGDVVTCVFYGDEEFVLSSESDSLYPVRLTRGKDIVTFTSDGRFSISNTAPVLKLVRKKIKKRTIIELFKVDSENESFFLNNNEFGSYDDALDWIKGNGVNGWVYSINKYYKINDL